MLKKIIQLSVILCLVTSISYSQGTQKISKFLLNKQFKAINFSKPTLNISDFKGKFIILDFWATWCSVCIEGFSKNEILQRKFGNDLQIILVNSVKVTGDDKKKVDIFFKRFKSDYPNFSLPSVYLDSALSDIFKPNVLPHYVWLNRNGEFIAETPPSQVNEVNIKAAIQGNLNIQVPFYKYSRNIPLFKNIDIYTLSASHIQSTFTGYIDGIGSGWVRDTPGRISWRNLRMYDHFQSLENFQKNRVVLSVKDTAAFLGYSTKNLFCYELIYPETMDKQARDILVRQDLNRYSGFEGKWEKRNVDCWIISIKDESRIPSGEGSINNEIQTLDYSQIQNGPIFINGTDNKKKIKANSFLSPYAKLGIVNDVVIDINEYRKHLDNIGFDLHKETRQIEMFVINENNLNR